MPEGAGTARGAQTYTGKLPVGRPRVPVKKKNGKKAAPKPDNKGQSLIDDIPIFPTESMAEDAVKATEGVQKGAAAAKKTAKKAVDTAQGVGGLANRLLDFFAPGQNWGKRTIWFLVGYTLMFYAVVLFVAQSKTVRTAATVVATRGAASTVAGALRSGARKAAAKK